jgi:hypothetical protein
MLEHGLQLVAPRQLLAAYCATLALGPQLLVQLTLLPVLTVPLASGLQFMVQVLHRAVENVLSELIPRELVRPH